MCSAESGAKLRFFRHARSQNSLGGACDGLESSKKNAGNTLCERVSRILLFLRQIPEGEVERTETLLEGWIDRSQGVFIKRLFYYGFTSCDSRRVSDMVIVLLSER